MPTPFYHLSIADELLQHPQLNKTVRRRLVANSGAFLFGNTAPDVQVVSGQTRQETHFFTLPIDETKPAWECFFTANPELAALSDLDPDRLAFIQDEHLSAWCSFLAQQLHPDGKTRTVQVFAEREGSDPVEFASLLNSAQRMEAEVFKRVPRDRISKYRQELIETNLSYLNICLS